MQTQDVPGEFLFKLWPWLEANKNRLIGLAAALIVAYGIFYFISTQREQREVDAGQALTSLAISAAAEKDNSQMASQYLNLAAKYSGTTAGQRALFQAAGALFNAGNYAEAETEFKKYLEANPSGSLAPIAELGIGASAEAQNKLDDAAAAYQRVVALFPDSVCVPTAQFAMGRIAERQNKFTEAMNHYQDAARSQLGGTVVNQAMFRAQELNAKLAANAAKAPGAAKPAATPQPFTTTPMQPAAKP